MLDKRDEFPAASDDDDPFASFERPEQAVKPLSSFVSAEEPVPLCGARTEYSRDLSKNHKIINRYKLCNH